MLKNLNNLIKRVLNASGNTELIAMVEYELNQPMFAHPGLAESYVKSFLGSGKSPEFYAGDSSAANTSVPVTIINGNTAIVDIRGAMMAKEINAVCGSSPTSYEAIVYEINNLMGNADVENIVARFATGGGVVSQLMDASDHIYNLRGKGKKLYAMIDDNAYSAGYGLASAFDEIWITRTGGVGSVGVVARTEDRSESNKIKGIKVEYLYAGDKKIFGNQDAPLSEPARKEMMDEISMHYTMFTNTVARNLGMTVDEVVATQAGTYTGEEAIKVGFAHKLGTFNDLLNYIEENSSMALSAEQIEDKKTLEASIAEKETKLAKDKEELSAEQTALVALDIIDAEDTAVDIDAEAEKADAAAEKAEAEVVAQEAADQLAANTAIELATANAREAGIRAVCAAAGKDGTITTNFINSDMTLGAVSASLTELSANDNGGDIENILNAEQTKANTQRVWADAFKHA